LRRNTGCLQPEPSRLLDHLSRFATKKEQGNQCLY
jgi:hypothetical protein